MNFVFYDLETSGLSKGYHQILQFAAIVTDEKLVEIDRVNLRCRLSPHILPSPIALAITGVSPTEFMDGSLPTEFEFSQQIRKFVAKWAPATWAGYNSMGFDEGHLRHLFYQNLQPNIYETQFNGNNRLDVMLVVYACRAKHPEALEWVNNAKGKVSYKLEHIAPANGFEGHDAHDALGDVEATIHVVKRIAQSVPDFWNTALKNRKKQDVISKIKNHNPVDFIAPSFGRLLAYELCFCCFSPTGQAVFFDIGNENPSHFMFTTEDQIRDLLERRPKIIQFVAVNKAPNLYEISKPSGELIERAETIKKNNQFRSLLQKVLEEDYENREIEEGKLVEQKIYDGWYSDSDKALLVEFQGSLWSERWGILEKIEDTRLKQLGRRLIVFQSDLELKQSMVSGAIKYIEAKWLSELDSEWTTFAQAEKEIHEIESNGMLSIEAISELRSFYDSKKEELNLGQLPRFQ